MHVRAGAFQQYTEAAIVDKMITSLPDIARAMAESFNKVDKITIVSTGEGGGAGSLTSEMTRMLAQVPAVVETLTGMKISEMVERLQGFPRTSRSADGALTAPDSQPTNGRADSTTDA
jgi:flotillin